jgi:hypothetical protein
LEKVEVDYPHFLDCLRNSAVNTFMGRMPNLEYVLIDARQEEFFKGLFSDRPDLMPKFVVA